MSTDVVVETSAGRIRGTRERGVETFKGIPYAEPPLGELRFRPPRKPSPWTGIRDATGYGNMAVQRQNVFALPDDLLRLFTLAGKQKLDENCLYLNVWTPGRDGTERPVLFWCHGGAFITGSGSSPWSDGANLCRLDDVVVVSFNHRLGALGYLHLEDIADDFEQAGLAGVLDIIAALEWVRDNIARFGGDPRNVTIFGESGGGAKVSVLMAMPKAKGLFHRAIIQSGPGVKALPPERAAALRKDLYAELGVTPGDVKALRALPYDRLLQASAAAEAKQPEAGFDRAGFSPVADDDILPCHPWDPAGPAVSWDVPVIIGLNKDEMTLFMASQPWFGKMDNAGLEAMAAGIYGPKAPQVLAALRKDFPKDSPTYLATHLVTYGRMFAGSVQIAERKAAQKGGNIWFYLLEWETPVGPFRSPHTLEIPLVFDNVDTARVLLGPGPEPQLMARQMSKAWVWFAKYGDPNSGDLPKWPTYDAAKRSTMIFNTTCRVVDDPYSATRKAVT